MKNNKHLITRRTAIATGLSSLGAMILYGCTRPTSPPTYGNILRMGDAFTYNAHRSLFSGRAMAKEYDRRDISSFPATGTTNPGDSSKKSYSEGYAQLQKKDFADWKLSVEGKVNKPGSFSLNDLYKFPSRTQITRHTCEEGWTAIGEWTGVPLSEVLRHAGIHPDARFINFYSYDGWADCIDMLDAFHPQTILAYGMNGKQLPLQHGAPLRLRVETQIGYKSMKYLQKIEVSDKFLDTGDSGWAWYVGV